MAKSKCPDCKRDSTYNAKFDQCSGCGRGYERTGSLPVAPARTGVGAATGGSEPVPSSAMEVLADTPKLVVGKPCPTCGKPVGKSKAQLQKEYRERKKK